ncbi:GAF domain-containing protein [Chitinibacter bivalviorum]|uniref:histidine kinase n=1 Tax=Chitinibacter bivalviorum TaxID=2739434 RepID=A0A7H9BP59_9NEIS|nr:ATP-binding protein [Chitinibacter bivalviorum]QLG89114.1 GAF domain-containing protein [Chitinibacter bivalviorum]
MLPLLQPFSSTPQFAKLIAQIELRLHNEREQAQQQLEALLRTSRAEHDAVGVIAAIEMLSQISYGNARIDLQYEALQMAQSHHLFDAEARLLQLIGKAYYASAQYREAIQSWARCLEVAELSQQYVTWVKAKVGLGQIYDALGDHHSAVKLHREAIARCEHLNDRWLLLQAHINLGVNLHKLRRSDEALDSFNFALDTARELKHADDEAEALMRLGEVHLSRQAFARAMTALDAAGVIAERTGYRWAWAQTLLLRAECLLKMARTNEALQLANQGLIVAEQAGAAHVRMRLLYLLSEICEQIGDLGTALQMQRQGQALDRKINQSTQLAPLEQVAKVAGLLQNSDQILLDLSSDPALEQGDIATLSYQLCLTACKVLNLAQASFWLWNDESLDCQVRTNALGELLKPGPRVAGEAFASLFDNLKSGEMIIAHSAGQHLYTWRWSEYALQAQDIQAILLVPVRLNEEFIAVLAFEHLGQQRNWLRDEIQHAHQLGLLAVRAMAQHRQNLDQQQIARLNTQLIEQNDQLETRVQERTRALSQASQKLIQAEKLAALGHLVAGFAHELNTPLGSILTAATTFSDNSREMNQQLQLGALKKSQVEQYIVEGLQIADLIERNAQRSSDLIRDLRQLSNERSTQAPESIVLATLLGEQVARLDGILRARHITVELAIARDVFLMSFRPELELIFQQLLQNSLLHGFTGAAGGVIQIHAQALHDGRLQIRYQDNGAGVSHELQKKIFEPFYTTQFGQGRSGLGLYQVYSIVHGKLGGEISLRSEVGQGLEITLTLPFEAPMTLA